MCLLWLLCGALLSAALGRETYEVYAIATVVLAVVVLCMLHRRRLKHARQLAERIAGGVPGAVPASLDQGLRTINEIYSGRFFAALVRSLGARVGQSRVIVVHQPGDSLTVSPIRVAFEPRPWEDGLFGTPQTLPDVDEPDSAAAVAPVRERPKRLVGMWLWLLVGSAALIWMGSLLLRELARSVLAGIPTAGFVVIVGAFLVAFASQYRNLRDRNSQCFLLPGGFAVRTSNWRSSRWKLHVYDRRHSVLLAYRDPRSAWRLWIADAEQCDSLTADDAQITLALRAWLSPLEPATVEQLGDLR